MSPKWIFFLLNEYSVLLKIFYPESQITQWLRFNREYFFKYFGLKVK